MMMMVAGGIQGVLNQASANVDPYIGIVQCFINEGILIVQQTGGLIVMYQQKMGSVKGCIFEYKRIMLDQFYPKDIVMVAFKLYQGNLYLKNDSISKFDVLSFRDGQFKKLYYY